MTGYIFLLDSKDLCSCIKDRLLFVYNVVQVQRSIRRHHIKAHREMLISNYALENLQQQYVYKYYNLISNVFH